MKGRWIRGEGLAYVFESIIRITPSCLLPLALHEVALTYVVIVSDLSLIMQRRDVLGTLRRQKPRKSRPA